jgi:hypothetical protein
MMKILNRLSMCFANNKADDSQRVERGAGDGAPNAPTPPANVKQSPPYVEVTPSSQSLTPQKFKARQRATSLYIIRLDGRLYDDTARAVDRICRSCKSYASLVRALANIARLLEDELSVCNSEIEYEKVLLSKLKVL